MAILGPFVNAAIWCDLSDLSGRANEVTIQPQFKALNSTTFVNGGWESNVAALGGAKIDVKGFWDAGTADASDDLFFGDVGVGGLPITVAPQGATVGNVAYMTTVMQPDYKPGGKVGDLLSFDTSKVADAKLVRGQVANVTAKTTTGTTAGLQLTAPTASQRVHCAVHVLSVSGTGTPTLTVAVQGDNGSGFPSPATVVTGAGITAPGSQYLKGAIGATSDNWYRLSLTISGTSPSFLLYAAIGVG